MIRVAVFLVCVGVLALGVAWFADRPGEVAVTWLGYRIETSMMVALSALIALLAVAIAAWSLLRFLLRSPEQVSLFIRNRRAMKSYNAISRGLIAIGAGDAQLARRSAGEAHRLAPQEPLALLLAAQAAQLSGEPGEAERAFRAMAERADTRLLGLRGLYIEAQRRSDTQAARLYAEEAAKDAHGVNWASQAVLDGRCAAGDWVGALDVLEQMRRGLDKATYRRRRAVLLTARALALADGDRDLSRDLAREAVKLAPSLVPAAALAGRQLAEAGERRKATRILDAAWRANPHPDLAEAYAYTRLGSSARERLARMRLLAEKTPGEPEAALAVARAALDAREFGEARSALAPYLAAPTQRVATLMAEIEEQEHGDAGRARQWMARALNAAPDPAWTADGVVSDRWLPVSPVSGRLDAFQWKVPVAEIGFTRPVIDLAAEAAAEAAAARTALATPQDSGEAAAQPPEAAETVVTRAAEAGAADAVETNTVETPPIETKPVETKPAETKVLETKPLRVAAVKAVPPAEPVIPLIHAPDDPGPGGTGADDPADAASAPPAPGPWQRVAAWFR